MPQTNYAQIIVEVTDKEATPKLKRPIQDALAKQIPGAWITVRQLQTNPVENPVELMISGQADVDAKNEAEDIRTLRSIARQAQDIVAQSPGVSVLRDDWFPDNLQLQVQIDPDRANVVGITNADVASASSAAMSGTQVGVFKEGNKNIPVVARLRMQERAQLADLKNLYVYSSQTNNRVPLLSVANFEHLLQTGRIARREHFRTISILCYPQPGVLASEVLDPIASEIARVPEKPSAADISCELGAKGPSNWMVSQISKSFCWCLSLAFILALLIQFNNAVKPILVFAAAPYGVIGSLPRPCDHAYAVRVYGFSRYRQPDRRDCQPRHRAVRLHRGNARKRRAPDAGACGCGHPANPAGDDHGGSNDPGSFPARTGRRSAVAASLLRADWWPWRRYLYHAALGAGPLQHLRARPEDHSMGSQ